MLAARSLLLWCLAGLFLCFALRELRIGNAAAFWLHAPHAMMFSWAVFGVAFWRLARSTDETPVHHRDLAFAFFIAAAAVPLAAETSLAGLGLCIGAWGGFTLWRGRNDPDLRSAGVCLMALCVNFSLSPLIFRVGYGALIGADMALLQYAIDLVDAPVRATPAGLLADDGMRVMLVGACSSFTGVSAAVLVHMGWAMAVRTHVGWRDAIAVVATVGVATMLNITRLTLTASGHESYAFWHGASGETPLGGQLFWFAQNAVLLTGGYLSAYWAGRPLLARQAQA